MKIVQIIRCENDFTLIALTDTGRLFYGELNASLSDEGMIAYDWREILTPDECTES